MVDDSQNAISAATGLTGDTLPIELDGGESGEEDAETLVCGAVFGSNRVGILGGRD